MAKKKLRAGLYVIVKVESTSKYSGELLRIDSLRNGFANLSQNKELVVLNMRKVVFIARNCH